MAEAQKTKTVEIPVSSLPKGLDPSKLVDVIASYQATRNRAKTYNEARRKAQSELCKRHRQEYEQLLKQFNPNRK